MTTTDFAKRAAKLNELNLELAADYLESRPVGSLVPIAVFRGNVPGHVDFIELSEYLQETDSPIAFWVVKKNNRTIGFFILLADAYKAYVKAPN